MFSGLGNQISGFVSSKIPGAAPAGGEPAADPAAAGVDPNADPNAAVGENGEVPPEGGAMGFAKGLFGKAMAVKEGAMMKAGEIGGGNIGVSWHTFSRWQYNHNTLYCQFVFQVFPFFENHIFLQHMNCI